MKKKMVAPAALNALKEALTNVYWYKAELRSFLTFCISDPSILGKLNWEDYKRNVVSQLINYLASDQDTYMGDLLKLMYEVTRITDYSHLERLDDGKEKARRARESVVALTELYKVHDSITREQKEVEERREAAFQAMMKNKGIAEKLEELKITFYSLIGSGDRQARGYELEKIMRELFDLFDLDPKASFRILGEQIDGAFTFENTDYLFEAKWQEDMIGIKELDAFSGKLSRKLDNTLGLYLSINGFSEDAVKAHSTGRRLMILMDGSDLMGVLDARIDLIQLLLKKRRHAAQTGKIYLRLHEVL